MSRSEKKCVHHCEIESTVAIIGGKWKVQIIWHIGKNKPRFNELRDILGNVSPRMLAKQLKELEVDGLVIRTMYPEIPPRVEYELTDAGKAFIPILEQIRTWIGEYFPEERIE
ncbi:winged helix-turn-helix transcriptional regulator [Methanoregula sp.]|uniref:winged helix-turn-helix transcriptional regulator n=1 Tax=Methanoregula sp. TaxID=2052170 RepID=UPI003BAE86E0